MISDQKLQEHIKRLQYLVRHKHIRQFDLTASIDCFGPEQEYVRFGLDIEQWKRNFEYVSQQRWIPLKINQTISALTIRTMPEMLKYINNLSADRKIGHYFGTVVMTHNFLHPEIFGAGFFDSDFEEILQLMPGNTEAQLQSKSYMQGIRAQLNSQSRDQTKINQLGVFLDEME